MACDVRELLQPLLSIHNRMRDAVVAATEHHGPDSLARVHRDDEGDTIYSIDAVSEEILIQQFEDLARSHPFVLIAEGLPGGQVVLPRGAGETEADWRIIVDPIDGTRALMYQKRSGWVLTG